MDGSATVTVSLEKFLDVLKQKGHLSDRDTNRVLELAETTSEAFDQIISKLGLMTEQAILETLSRYTGLEPLPIEDLKADPNLGKAYNEEFLSRNRLLPVLLSKEEKALAVVDPFSRSAIEGAVFANGHSLPLRLITHGQWEQLFASVAAAESHQQIGEESSDISRDAARLMDLASSEPVIRLVNRLIARGSETGASDIHIETGARETRLRFRVDGVLSDLETLSPAQGLSVLSRLKILADLDIAERRKPQDGRFSFPLAGRAIDLRVSIIPTDYGESAVLRLLDHAAVTLDTAALGFSTHTTESVNRLLTKPHGILLVTGPTGSGKTTSLYTFLKQLATQERKILTIEDPIEYRLPGISQSQVNPQIDVTFASALRSFLRHDPDVMMVGEIRDLETATIAIQAALTGHLVLSTLHTNDAVSAITRLRDLGVEDYLIASTLIGILGQRLVRRLCEACEGQGECRACQSTGYKGRVAIVETLEMSDPLGDALRNGASETQLLKLVEGFTSMRDDGDAKVAAGLTSPAEITRTLGATHG